MKTAVVPECVPAAVFHAPAVDGAGAEGTAQSREIAHVHIKEITQCPRSDNKGKICPRSDKEILL